MASIYWLSQTESDVPADDDWLCPAEALRLSGMRFAKRRADWRLGRWTAKRALALCLSVSGDRLKNDHPTDVRLEDDRRPHEFLRDEREVLSAIEIRSAPSGAPEVFLRSERAAVTISLSHRFGKAVCAVARGAISLGCDLERVEPHSDVFVGDYFTVAEQTSVAQSSPADRFSTLALLWSGKESALKALHIGLRLDTRELTVIPEFSSETDGWHPLAVRGTDSQIFHGWWQRCGEFVQTMVSTPSSLPPICLRNRIASPAA